MRTAIASHSTEIAHLPHAPAAERARDTVATRLKRFARYLERYARGEPVHSYDQNWLAFLKENRMERRQRP
jgi:hypothetical protein